MICPRILTTGLRVMTKQSTNQRSHVLFNVFFRRQHQKTSSPYQRDEMKEISRVHDDLKDGLDPFAKLDETKKSFLEDLRPPLKRSYNLAAYVNSSKSLQKLVKLGVSLYDIENNNPKAAKQLTLLNFEEDCLPYIKFLVDNGLKGKNIGRFISEYPEIFQVPREDLETRLKYLQMKGFSAKQISRAINRSCQILANNVKSLDYKLGEFQVEFQMPAKIIKEIVSTYPPVISLPSGQYKMINFTLTEEFGFNLKEVHAILMAQPKILDILRPVLIERLDLVHNTIGLSHETICKFPKLLTGPIIDVRHRYAYLKRLKRNQFDPEKPLYVPPSALYSLDDEQFCERIAKTSIEDYKLFLRNS